MSALRVLALFAQVAAVGAVAWPGRAARARRASARAVVLAFVLVIPNVDLSIPGATLGQSQLELGLPVLYEDPFATLFDLAPLRAGAAP